MPNFKRNNGNLRILVIFPGWYSLYYRSSRIETLYFWISTVRAAPLSYSCLLPWSFFIMNKKNVHRTFFTTREQLQVLRTFFLARVGSYPLGSRREMLRIVALVHLLPSLLSLTCFYLIMGNSTPLFFSRQIFFTFIASWILQGCKIQEAIQQNECSSPTFGKHHDSSFCPS